MNSNENINNMQSEIFDLREGIKDFHDLFYNEFLNFKEINASYRRNSTALIWFLYNDKKERYFITFKLKRDDIIISICTAIRAKQYKCNYSLMDEYIIEGDEFSYFLDYIPKTLNYLIKEKYRILNIFEVYFKKLGKMRQLKNKIRTLRTHEKFNEHENIILKLKESLNIISNEELQNSNLLNNIKRIKEVVALRFDENFINFRSTTAFKSRLQYRREQEEYEKKYFILYNNSLMSFQEFNNIYKIPNNKVAYNDIEKIFHKNFVKLKIANF